MSSTNNALVYESQCGRMGGGGVLRGLCLLVGSFKMNTTLKYSTRVVQEGGRRCKKSTLNDLAYLTPLRIPLMNPVYEYSCAHHVTWSPYKLWRSTSDLDIQWCRGVDGLLTIFVPHFSLNSTFN
jgi:hypothetical protein